MHSNGDIVVEIKKTNKAIISITNPVNNEDNIDVNRIFERFYTSDKSRNKSTGLGLSIVSILVEQLGGNTRALIMNNILEIIVELPVAD